MSDLYLVWLLAALLIAVFGASWAPQGDGRLGIANRAVLMASATLACTLAAWGSFAWVGNHDGSFLGQLWGLDPLTAPLLPLVALIYWLTTLTTVRTKLGRFSFRRAMISEVLLLALLVARDPWLVIFLAAATCYPVAVELRQRGRSARVLLGHMGLSTALALFGQAFLTWGPTSMSRLWGVLPLFLAVLIRCGVFPFHSWVPHLYQHASFGTALLFTAPLTGAYLLVRLVLPQATDELLQTLGLMSIFTAVYAAGLALVQSDGRRLFAYLLLSHAALVLCGMEMVTVTGLTGALSLWLSVGISLTGFGLVLRAIEARCGSLPVHELRGLYLSMPSLASSCLVLGLASVGFPGTIGFIGAEMLVEGAVVTYPHVGLAVVVAAALNGIAVVHCFLMMFGGPNRRTSVSLGILPRERIAVLVVIGLVFLGGAVPQIGVASRHHAAEALLAVRGPALPSPIPHRQHSNGRAVAVGGAVTVDVH